ncbi:ribosomal protein S2 [Tilletiaria anomala UBC 951]|uniref:Ribosomal protein S2 n=1 Tax=Tilletiaria anomala (strain ATCC 24038 / CBS 436.72 / UBC 951) TaxID=1037660 RepID=A0A066VZ97_TILAU|nr:ribosomal protein S2 [Tilletiaria anomala UBC 951]KDN45618.1 ribosomal protein S2 [Tilletiaria anomala UBC 951]
MAALETDILDVQEEVDTERELRRLRRTMVDQFQSLGSTQNRETTFRPHHARMSPKAARDLTISHLLASNAHVGHHKSQTTRAFQPLLLGTRNNMSIIDIEKHTLPALKRCAQVVRKVLSADGVILFVGTGKNQTASILRACKRLGRNAFHVTMERWIPGTLTNAPKLLAPAIYKSFEDADADLSGAPDTTKLASQTFQPDLVVVLNPRENVHAVREATDRNIPTIGIIDTNVDPRLVTYAIPGNDDSLRFVDLVVGVIARAGQEGIAEGARLRDEADKARRSDERGRRRLLQA